MWRPVALISAVLSLHLLEAAGNDVIANSQLQSCLNDGSVRSLVLFKPKV